MKLTESQLWFLFACALFAALGCSSDPHHDAALVQIDPLTPPQRAVFDEMRQCYGYPDAVPPRVIYEPGKRECNYQVQCCLESYWQLEHRDAVSWYDQATNTITISQSPDPTCQSWIDKHSLRGEMANAVFCQMEPGLCGVEHDQFFGECAR